MAQDATKFSHITVTSDDEDDVVIQAGARPSAQPAPALVEEPAAPAQPEAPAPAPQPAAAPQAKRREGYRETTAEDLESEPMSLMQKAVIAIAAVLVVAAIAYVVTH